MALELEGAEGSVSKATVEFLAKPQALQPYVDKLTQLTSEVEQASTRVELAPHVEAIDATAAGLDLLSELMTTIKVEDTTLRTQIVDAISEVYAGLNQCRARARNKQKNVGTEEAIADFSAQFKLFSQSIVNALGLSTTPDRCDEQLSRLLIQLEELESQFSEYDQFLTDIVEKREEIYESFEAR
jgi:predicted  nucleic acid-binding Zn-ribbon protein